jgi:heat shock protein HslJ
VTRRPIGVKTILLATAALLALTLSGCGDEDSTPTAHDEPSALSLDVLDGRAFASDQVDGHRLVADSQILLTFTGSDISAYAGCNHLLGTASVDGGKLTTGSLAGTEIGCPKGLNDQDVWLSTFLASGPSADLDGNTLTLTDGDVTIELIEQDVTETPAGDPDQPTSDGDGVVDNTPSG